jgi:hypothetical protein
MNTGPILFVPSQACDSSHDACSVARCEFSVSADQNYHLYKCCNSDNDMISRETNMLSRRMKNKSKHFNVATCPIFISVFGRLFS